LEQYFEIDLEKYPKIGGETFHARDVFGPVAGELAAGLEPAMREVDVESIVKLEILATRFEGDEAQAEILHIDRFGNVVLNIDESGVPGHLRPGCDVMIGLGGKQYRARFVKAYGDLPAGSLLITFGGTGLLEIAVSEGNASSLLRAKPGQKVELRISPSSQ
ncbi:MAG: SAM hydroxide adenosyltransferase, partial [Nitrososphaerota archaeon]